MAGKGTRTLALTAPVHGAVIAIEVTAGQAVAAGHTLVLQEAMKMEVPLEAPSAGRVLAIAAAVGDVAEADGDVELDLANVPGWSVGFWSSRVSIRPCHSGKSSNQAYYERQNIPFPLKLGP